MRYQTRKSAPQVRHPEERLLAILAKFSQSELSGDHVGFLVKELLSFDPIAGADCGIAIPVNLMLHEALRFYFSEQISLSAFQLFFVALQAIFFVRNEQFLLGLLVIHTALWSDHENIKSIWETVIPGLFKASKDEICGTTHRALYAENRLFNSAGFNGEIARKLQLFNGFDVDEKSAEQRSIRLEKLKTFFQNRDYSKVSLHQLVYALTKASVMPLEQGRAFGVFLKSLKENYPQQPTRVFSVQPVFPGPAFFLPSIAAEGVALQQPPQQPIFLYPQQQPVVILLPVNGPQFFLPQQPPIQQQPSTIVFVPKPTQ
ncbi:MAG: hypothetical protein COY58_04460 [Gammaproteobacteria bacterium CG_4_10_14_0_8_um_filter_38_16]|nr:MAG: hypothetical protein COY58_04460 [Gammaproteobacteria bacterium CG_4_10_14_0_8_um_filter_38_16]PJA04439.1 MAG: hypothetical protein COX72_00010 [Gammaproteobacteria bacterium CG_4_10_14_0_2_um_filter_38_22]PJB11004.1 MAG: hypothetical protein CO120_01770 [Gammaproteobacteria bacterium CG_4_9_14_3_um_filter_38_9]